MTPQEVAEATLAWLTGSEAPAEGRLETPITFWTVSECYSDALGAACSHVASLSLDVYGDRAGAIPLPAPFGPGPSLEPERADEAAELEFSRRIGRLLAEGYAEAGRVCEPGLMRFVATAPSVLAHCGPITVTVEARPGPVSPEDEAVRALDALLRERRPRLGAA